jgi:hypothetical protein
MTMKKIKIILSALIINMALFDVTYAADKDSANVPNGLSISYVRKGCQVGLERYFFQSEKYKIVGTASLLFQRVPSYYSSAGLVLNNMVRRTSKIGIYWEQGIKLGYVGSYYDFDIYDVNSDGEIVNNGRKWLSSAIVGFSIGLGYDFSKKTKANLQLFFKPGLFYRFPNNDNPFYLNDYSIEAGLAIHPKWFNKKK